jgi:hypothetical protein
MLKMLIYEYIFYLFIIIKAAGNIPAAMMSVVFCNKVENQMNICEVKLFLLLMTYY